MRTKFCPRCGSHDVELRIIVGQTGKERRTCRSCGYVWEYTQENVVKTDAFHTVGDPPNKDPHISASPEKCKVSKFEKFFARQQRWQRGLLLAAFLVSFFMVPLFVLVNLFSIFQSDIYLGLTLLFFYGIFIPVTIVVCKKIAKLNTKYADTEQPIKNQKLTRRKVMTIYILVGFVLFIVAPFAELVALMLLIPQDWGLPLWIACISSDMVLFVVFSKYVPLPSNPLKKKTFKQSQSNQTSKTNANHNPTYRDQTTTPRRKSTKDVIFVTVVIWMLILPFVVSACGAEDIGLIMFLLFYSLLAVAAIVRKMVLKTRCRNTNSDKKSMPRGDPYDPNGRVYREWVARQRERQAQQEQTQKHNPNEPFYHEGMTGVEYEKYVCYRLTQMGYKDVKMTKASDDNGADILAVTPDGQTIAIQCKKYKDHVGKPAVYEAISARDYYFRSRAAVITNSVFTRQAKEFAKRTRVELYENFK